MKDKATQCVGGLSVVVLSALLVIGCAEPHSLFEEEDKGTVKLAYVNWAEGVAVTHLVDVLLRDEGYDVELMMADMRTIYTAVADGDQDVMIETWLPVTHESYYDEYGDRIELISPWFDAARIGLVVPDYVDIDSIEELNAAADQFDGVIIGIDPGAGIMNTTGQVIEEYDLEMELMVSSGPAMAAALQGAIQNEDWIVVTGWEPHWKFARFDLKFLDDPKGVYGAAETVHTAARLGFAEEYPEVTEILENMAFSSEEIGSLMDVMDGAEGVEELAIRQWISENQELVDNWLP